jgi:hypothetical protein
MAHWSKMGKDPPRKLLGNRVFALAFASSYSAQLQSVQEEDTAQAPAPKDFISDRLAASAPEQVEDKWGFYAESGLNRTLERAIIPRRCATDGPGQGGEVSKPRP